MNDELMNYARGETTPRRQDRTLAAKARGIYEEVRLGALMADGALVLSGHIMGEVVELDEERRSYSRRVTPNLNAVLIEIEVTGIEQAQKVQRNLYKRWK